MMIRASFLTVVFAIALVQVANAQTTSAFEDCINSKVAAGRKQPNHVTSSDRFQPQENPVVQEFRGGGEFKLVAFFQCHNIEISGKVNAQGVFENSDAMRGLKAVYDYYRDGSRLKRIDVVHDWMSVEYTPKDDSYTIHVSDYLSADIRVAEEPNLDQSVVRNSYIAGLGVDRQAVNELQLDSLDDLYSKKAFLSQGGTVSSVSFDRFSWNDSGDPYATKLRAGYDVFLGIGFAHHHAQIPSLADFLAKPKSLKEKLKLLGISVSFDDDIYEDHIAALYAIVATFNEGLPAITQIVLNNDKNERSYLKGSCTKNDCSGLKLYLSRAWDDKFSAKLMLGSDVGDILKFFAAKKVSVPDRLTSETIDNLLVIGKSWKDELRIKKISLTSEANQIKKTGYGKNQYNEIELNEDKDFSGYTELINGYYFDKP